MSASQDMPIMIVVNTYYRYFAPLQRLEIEGWDDEFSLLSF